MTNENEPILKNWKFWEKWGVLGNISFGSLRDLNSKSFMYLLGLFLKFI